MKLHWVAVLALVAGRGAMAADTPVPLQPGAGAELASARCSMCHTSDYIVMNSVFLTPDAWKAEVTKMRSVYGAPIDDETAAKIVAYLAAQYAAEKKP